MRALDADPNALVADQVQAHVAYVRLAVVGTAAIAVGLAAALWDAVDHRSILAWLACLIPPYAWRTALAFAYHRAPGHRPDPAWLRQFRLTFALHGGVWGLASLLLFPPDVAHQSFLAFVVGGITAGSLTMTAFDLVAGLLFLIIGAGPLSIRLLLEGDHIASAMGLGVGLFLAYMIVNATRMHGRYVETVMLRRASSVRAESLSAFQTALSNLWKASGDDPVEVQRITVREAAIALDLDRAMLWLFDRSRDAFTLCASAGRQPVDVDTEPTLRLSRAPLYLEGLQSLVDTTPGASTPPPYGELIGTTFAPSIGAARLDIPMRAAGRIDGVLCCERAISRPWTPDEQTFVTTVAAIALAATKEEDRRQAERRLRDLNEDLEHLVAERTGALQRSEQRFRAVFAASPVMIALIRVSDQQILEANRAAFEAFGFTPEESIGRTSPDLNLWADPVERARVVEQIRQQGYVSDLECQMRRKDGTVFWALVNSRLVDIGGDSCRLTTLLDITERRRLDARFVQSQKMEVVGHLAGGIAHDFNNVLTVITSTAELAMVHVPAGQPLHESLSTIRDAGTRAAALTRQLLTFGRRQILQPEVLDVNTIVVELGPMLRRVMGEHITIDTRLSADGVSVVADRGSLEQVILNLAINSRDAMPAGGTLTLTTTRTDLTDSSRRPGGLARGPYVVITARDTGVGMDQSTIDRVFEPFFTTKEAGKGTGLGLSTAHGIINQSGGHLGVASTVGLGSEFTAYLPRVDSHADAPRPSRTASQGGTEAILVVDDDPDIRDVVQRALESAGYAVASAMNAHDALQTLDARDGAINLIVTDVIMPGLSGHQLADRALARYPTIRVLYMSGYADDAIAERGVLTDGVQFLAKPFLLKELIVRVRETLDA